MPEGDTIHRAARTLALRLGGKQVLRFHSTVPLIAQARLEGARVASVEARGKNLQVAFDDGSVLTTHMRMTGSWHVYHPGERWFLPEHLARVVIEVEGCVAVCFSAPVVELYSSSARLDQARLGRLGPDLLSPAFAAAEAVTRLLTKPRLRLGEALLDQSLLSGIGNVYKSESLFLERLSPFLATSAVPRERLLTLVSRARTLMLGNLAPGGGMRTTRGRSTGPRFWVYRRSGRACLVCEATVLMKRQGESLRSTYFCPRCQGVPSNHDGAL